MTVSIPDEFAQPTQAGNLGPDEFRRIAKAPRGIGLVCDAAADALEKSGTKFAAPAGAEAWEAHRSPHAIFETWSYSWKATA